MNALLVLDATAEKLRNSGFSLLPGFTHVSSLRAHSRLDTVAPTLAPAVIVHRPSVELGSIAVEDVHLVFTLQGCLL